MELKTVMKYWREGLIVIFLVVGTFFGLSWWTNRNQKLLAENQIRQAEVKFETFKSGVTQAENTLVQSHKEMIQSLDESYQKQLEKNHEEILAMVKTHIAIEIKKGKGNGEQTGSMQWAYKDTVMKSITVDARDQLKPVFEYEIRPIELNLTGTLNIDLDGQHVRFWSQPTVTSGTDGVGVKISSMTLTPGKDFNAWTSNLAGKATKTPVMPKWTVSGLAGKEFLREIPGGQRTVYGFEGTRNFTNGLGVGAGVIGSTVYGKLSFSFGVQ